MTASVAVYTPAMVLIAEVPRRQDVQWQDELNTPGAGSFQIHLDDPILSAHPTILNDFNIVQISVDGTPVKSFVIESKQATFGEADDRWVTVAGRGVLCLLANAVVYPEYALKSASADERSFDFGSKEGGWRVLADWDVPLGIMQGNASSIRKGYPTRWPDRFAQWLWSTNPNATSASGNNYFRMRFHLTSACRVTIFAAGDDRLWLQLDGEQIIYRGVGGWKNVAAYTTTLDSGWHLIAGNVQNYQPWSVLRAGGFLCSVAKVDSKGKILGWLQRTSPGSTQVRGYGAPPGWFGASILKTLVTEAQARSVRGFSGISIGFSDTLDTDGVAWTDRQDRSFEIGKRDLLDVAAQLTETDFDLDMSPDLELRAWKNRGNDLSGSVELTWGGPDGDVLEHTTSSNAAPVKTRALVRHKGGWIEYIDSAAATAYGRRETGMVVGSTSSDSQAETFSVAAFSDLGRPEVTIPITTTSAKGPQPYADYEVGDIITTPGLDGTPGPARLMALTATEDDNGVLTFTHELYPED